MTPPRPAPVWPLLAVLGLWTALTAAQTIPAPVPQWVGIVLTVVVSGLVPVGWLGITLYRGHARELEEVRTRLTALEIEIYGKTGSDGLRKRVEVLADRTHAIPSIRQIMEWLEQQPRREP